MEILFGLVVVTVALIGWGYGLWPVALFLTLGDLFYLGVIGLFRNSDPTLEVFAIVSIAVIWAPFLLRRIKASSPSATDDRQTLSITSRSDDIVGGVLTVLAFLGVGWMFLHDLSDTWSLITSRPFLTMMGFVALAGLGLGWAKRST